MPKCEICGEDIPQAPAAIYCDLDMKVEYPFVKSFCYNCAMNVRLYIHDLIEDFKSLKTRKEGE